MWFVGLLMCTAQVCDGELSGSVPRGVPDPTRWPIRPIEESVDAGTFRLANTTITFHLSVEPGLAGLYRVSAYRTCDHAAIVCDPETLVWLRPSPNGHRPVAVVFYRFQRRKLLVFRQWYWYPVPHGSPEYEIELTRVQRLFFLSTQLRDGIDPASLIF